MQNKISKVSHPQHLPKDLISISISKALFSNSFQNFSLFFVVSILWKWVLVAYSLLYSWCLRQVLVHTTDSIVNEWNSDYINLILLLCLSPCSHLLIRIPASLLTVSAPGSVFNFIPISAITQKNLSSDTAQSLPYTIHKSLGSLPTTLHNLYLFWQINYNLQRLFSFFLFWLLSSTSFCWPDSPLLSISPTSYLTDHSFSIPHFPLCLINPHVKSFNGTNQDDIQTL